jgi:hypothetical protein
MLIALLVIFLGLFIWRLIATEFDIEWDTTAAAALIFGIIDLIAIFVTLGILMSVSRTIPKQIALYEEENKKIESQLDITVQQYMQYEENIFTEVAKSNESSITLVSLYPELKSDKLVQAQIEVYVENNKKIKELKERQVSESVIRFWLYFGR